jgi:hypothetical protein
MSIKISQDMIGASTSNMLNVGTSSGMSKPSLGSQNKGGNANLMDLDSIFSSGSSSQPQSNPIEGNSNQGNQKSDFDSIFSTINFGSTPNTNNNFDNNNNANSNTGSSGQSNTMDIFSQINNVLFIYYILDL